MRSIGWIAALGLAVLPATSPVVAQNFPVYRGVVRLPNFTGRDKPYANYRTRIIEEMKSGPNFAGHYAIVQIGCGTSCRFAIVGDVATGRLYDFPYGGEDYYGLDLSFGVKSNYLTAKWLDGEKCVVEDMIWNGAQFKPLNRRSFEKSRCDN